MSIQQMNGETENVAVLLREIEILAGEILMTDLQDQTAAAVQKRAANISIKAKDAILVLEGESSGGGDRSVQILQSSSN